MVIEGEAMKCEKRTLPLARDCISDDNNRLFIEADIDLHATRLFWNEIA